MPFLLDTNILSEFRKKDATDPNVKKWRDSVSGADLWVSVLVLGELRTGVERLRRRDPAQSMVFETFLTSVREQFAKRIVPITEEIADEWGRMGAPDPITPVDGLIAATAKVHGWTVVTRNVADFERTGVAILNPFEPPAAN